MDKSIPWVCGAVRWGEGIRILDGNVHGYNLAIATERNSGTSATVARICCAVVVTACITSFPIFFIVSSSLFSTHFPLPIHTESSMRNSSTFLGASIAYSLPSAFLIRLPTELPCTKASMKYTRAILQTYCSHPFALMNKHTLSYLSRSTLHP